MPIATNPDTGEAVFLGQDGQWSPAKIAVNPETKERLAFDGSDWVALKAPEPSTSGMLKQFGSEAAKSVLSNVGIGGDIRELTAKGADWLSNKITQQSGPSMAGNVVRTALRPLPPYLGGGPTSQEAIKTAENYFGQFRQPQNTAEEYAGTAGSFLPAVAGPGRAGATAGQKIADVGRRLVTQVAIPAATSETAGQITRGIDPNLEPYARLAGGVLGGVSASKLEGAAARPGVVKSVPAQEDIKQAAEDAYKEARKLDIAMSPASTRTLATNIGQTLDMKGFRDFTTPKTYRAIEELKSPKTKMAMTAENGATTKEVVSTLNDVIATRSLLGRIAADPNEKAAATTAIKRIDTYIENLRKSRPAIFGEQGSEAARLLGKNGIAPGNYAAAKRSEQITEALDRAANNAASAGTGANVANAIRQQIRPMLNNPSKKLRGFSPEEIAALRRVNRGTTGGNIARGLGTLAPTGVVSGALSPVIGAMLGSAAGPVGTLLGAGIAPVLGMVGRQISNATTARQAAYADALIRSRSPLAASTRNPAEIAALLANKPPWLRQALISGLMLRSQLPVGVNNP